MGKAFRGAIGVGEVAGSNPVGPISQKRVKSKSPQEFQTSQRGDFLCENSEKSVTFLSQSVTFLPQNVQSVTQVLPSTLVKSNSSGNFWTVSQVAERLGRTRKTILEWCESGKLPAISKSYGKKTTYQISYQAVEMLIISEQVQKIEKQKKKEPVKSHSEMIPKWQDSMSKGTLTGKPFSPLTQKYYAFYVIRFIAKHNSLTLEAVKSELMRMPPYQFGKRDKFFKAIVCFAKFLIREGILETSFMDEVKSFRPKRSLPPKRLTVDENGLEALLKACESPQDRLIVGLLSETGLRASEACSLKWEDIDIEKGVLTVKLGKGNKTRRVGLSIACLALLQKHMEEYSDVKPHQSLFKNSLEKPLYRDGLYHRLERIGKKAGVKVSPHALRRTFVTLNASKGRPLPMLQMACGHSDIKTTMSYCRIEEDAVIEAMKQW